MLFKTKNSYTYTDNFGKRHKLKISDSEVICAPYDILPTGNMALQTQGICKLMYWEKYQDMKLCSKSILCKRDESLLQRTLTKEDINKIALSEKELQEIIAASKAAGSSSTKRANEPLDNVKAKLYYYENEENYQHGHGKLLKEGDIDTLLSPAKAWHYNREEKLCIVSHDTEGYIGELSFDATNYRDTALDDMWLYPDPNYRGDIDNRFYGTLRDFKNKSQEKETEIELD